jgi:hypothetical protein
MFNVGIAFEILDDKQPIPPGWKENSAHLVFGKWISQEKPD